MSLASRRVYSKPQKFARIGYILILATFGVAGSWAAFARIDSATVAHGTVVLENHRRIVQHLEGGIVKEIHVSEGDHVAAGDTLVVLDSVEARAEVDRLTGRLNEYLAIQARLEAERTFQPEVAFPEPLRQAARDGSLSGMLAAQSAILTDRLSIFNSQSAIMSSRIEQLKQQVEGLLQQENALGRRVALRGELLGRLTRGEAMGVVETNRLDERTDTLIEIEADLGAVRSEIARIRASVGEAEFNLLHIRQEFLSQANLELEDTRTKISETRHSLTVARDILTRKTILASAAGSVQNIMVTTIGAVIRPGEILMEVVPTEDNLMVSARVSPVDIDSVQLGQQTMVRFSSFKTQRFPVVLGTVESVSDDVILPQNAQEPPYYLTRIRVPEENMPAEILQHLTAGMPADVVIVNGERTVLNYLWSPLENSIALSMREQ